MSVFCEEHHEEQLRRIGAKIVTSSDRIIRRWNRRGNKEVYSDEILIMGFFDDVESGLIETTYDDLPSEFQELIADYLERTPVEMIPRCFLIGPAREEDRIAATELRKSNARLLKAHIAKHP